MLQVDAYSLKERFEMKCLYPWCKQTSCLLGVLHCVHMWATVGYHYVYVDYYLSQVADHPMSSPCWVDRAGPVLAYRTMHFIKSWKTSAVSTTVWMVETQLSKLRGTSDTYVRIICFLWTKRTIWLLILSFTQNIVRACSMFYPYEGYRSVTPLDAARVNRTFIK